MRGLALQTACLLLALGILVLSRAEPLPVEMKSWKAIAATPAWLEKAGWGPLQGLGADFSLLKVFSIYYDASRQTNHDNSAWHAMKRALFRAQALDPQFIDPYHIGIITLAYDAKLPKDAVRLALLGSRAIPDNWQVPFTGGFVAYDALKDHRQASQLMTIAANVPNAPPLAVHLAGRFIAKDSGPEEGIKFLQKMLLLLPEQYHSGILQRIEELKKQGNL